MLTDVLVPTPRNHDYYNCKEAIYIGVSVFTVEVVR
jgi:hypothetical protein